MYGVLVVVGQALDVGFFCLIEYWTAQQLYPACLASTGVY